MTVVMVSNQPYHDRGMSHPRVPFWGSGNETSLRSILGMWDALIVSDYPISLGIEYCILCPALMQIFWIKSHLCNLRRHRLMQDFENFGGFKRSPYANISYPLLGIGNITRHRLMRDFGFLGEWLLPYYDL